MWDSARLRILPGSHARPCSISSYCCPTARARASRQCRIQAQDSAGKAKDDGPSGSDSQQLPASAGPYDRLRAAQPRHSANQQAHLRTADGRVLFAIPPASLNTPTSDVLECPNMRDFLGEPRGNPLLGNLAGIWEGRYVSDDDRVALNVMDFASPASTGAYNMCSGSTPSSTVITTAAATPAGGTTHLPLTSGVYGSLQSVDNLLGSLTSMDGGARQQQQQQQQQLQPRQQHDMCVSLPPYAMRAGPREDVYFDPQTVTAAIVTTGGICPGMNDVIEAMVKRLGDYGVPEDNVMGIRYGMRGFYTKDAKPVVLTRDKIDGIHLMGGTILGTSNDHRLHHKRNNNHCRHHHHHNHHGSNGASSSPAMDSSTPSPGSSSPGSSSSSEDEATASTSSSSSAARNSPVFETYEDRLEAILDKLEFWRINMLLVIGGQGGNQMGAELAEGCQRRGIPCCIVGVPKSIDNDVMLVDKTFGFDTVVQEVVTRPLLAAKVEAASARKGVGLVKVFGRRAGFIALQASLASGAVDICLIPEEPFELEGPNGVLAFLEELLAKRGHAVICVSEGAGQDLLYPGNETIPVDEAGNPKLRDIGAHLKAEIKKAIPDADVKYIDPTYMVQAVPCNASDHIYCRILGFHAVDVAFAGFTGVLVGQVNGHFCLLPSAVVAQSARRVDPRGKNWNRLRASIGQPRFINGLPPNMVPQTKPVAATAAAAGKVGSK